jgi:hypothetical protein
VTEGERRFTVAEANAELDDLRERLPRLREARRKLIQASQKITEAVAADGGGVANRDWFDAQTTLRTDLTDLAERGIMLRDPETGLIDFPSEREGARVYLCWRLGEDQVGFFHDETTGFTGRLPL